MNKLCHKHNFFPSLFGSDPLNVSFHFLIPKGGNVKLSYHKLKVLLPDSNLTVTRWAHKLAWPLYLVTVAIVIFVPLVVRSKSRTS